MLVLTRSRNQSIRIGQDVCITVLEVKGNQVRIGVKAPLSIAVDREEIYLLKQRQAESDKGSPAAD